MKHPAEVFLEQIEAFIARSGVSASRLGKDAVSDPNFVGDLRRGRMPSLDLVDRVNRFMVSFDRRAA